MNGKRALLAAAIHRAVNGGWCDTPFAWGQSDCLLALADIIYEARGYDPAAPYRGRYNSALGAIRVTAEDGGFAGALARMAKHHGWKPIEPCRAKIGDVGVVANSRGPRCGVICNGIRWVGRSYGRGFIAVERDLVARAWLVT